ncbi:OmpP1/FadL family transporter [Marixanthomonas ophiurae]|uniref:Aromatic hydrocarbon degradation protein n=1 Tax=Marixanthomonas ophiurae TaxID=387659 RepID=A0A3E1Q9I3_9FLAO|nr:hypothetical protein [Marixanthomonas ophiurae]RFN58789.1 hypothetical protein DZ858_01530 [Marixanthomonas ophiurae]
MLKRIIVTVLVLFIASAAMAQEGTTSPYSFYGIGSLKFKGTAENRMMGGIGVLSDSIHLNLQNPASVAGLELVNFTVGASHKQSTLKTDGDSQNASTTSLDYIAVGIPIGKFGASFGLIPYTSVGYQLQNEKQTETGRSITRYTGTGGINKAFLTLAYQITPKLSFGVDANYNFGNIENKALNAQEDIEFASREINKSDLLGFSFNFGAAYKTMITEKLELSTSLTYTPETDFTSENSREIASVIINSEGAEAIVDARDIEVEDTDFSFPSQITVGAGIGKPKNWYVGAEYTNQKTSNFTNRTFTLDNVEFKDASKYRVGGFYIPNYNGFGSYWKRVVYRAGMRFEGTGINVNGEDINEFGISFGVGLPVSKSFSNINLGFEVGRRGTKDAGLIQENFFNAFISLSLNDRWFQKRLID